MSIGHQLKLSFVHIPKNAGGSIQLTLGMKSLGHKRYKYYEKYKYPILAVIRNPLDRFVSCLMFAKQFNEHQDKEICSGKFKDVIKKLINNPKSFKHEGWLPQHYFICKGNKIMVDIIFRFETLNNDFFNYFGKRLIHHNNTIRKNYEFYFNDKTKNMIIDFYRKDFELFYPHLINKN